MRVPLPARALGELPEAGAEDVVAQPAQEPLVERPQVGVGLLVGPAGEKDGQLDPAAVELTLVHEPRTRLPERRDRRCASLPGRESGRRTRLVVVLDETHEPVLVGDVGGEVPVHGVGAVVQRAGRTDACRSSRRNPAAGARTRDPSTPRP